MTNSEVERKAIEHVIEQERAAGRQPEDVHRSRAHPYDIWSPPRKIEVKAFGGSARSAQVPIEERQAQAAREDPDNYYIYVVDNVARETKPIEIRKLHGALLQEMLDRAKPSPTYWPAFYARDYDDMDEGVD